MKNHITVSDEDFSLYLAEAISKIPPEIRRNLHNIDISFEYSGNFGYPRGFSKKSGLLGLYTGIPVSRRGNWYSFVCPDRIVLFKDNIERMSGDIQQLKKIIMETLIHEIAHYMGMDENTVRRFGY